MIELVNVRQVVSPGSPLEKTVLDGIDLKIDRGEFVTVIGTNGAGKSSLLNAIAGECIITHGMIKIEDRDITHYSTDRRAPWISRVFQDPLMGSCGELTIAENMAMAYRRGKNKTLGWGLTSELRDFFMQNLKRLNLGLEMRLDTQVGQLSGGQRQALSLIMATLSPLKILLLDEHTSALDPKSARTIMDLTHQIVQENKLTALIVTHSTEQALHFGTRTLLLHQGKIVQDWVGSSRSSLDANRLFELYS
jgi:putative ABC transport system ATP-binding protein